MTVELWNEDYARAKLFDAWYLSDEFEPPQRKEWPVEMAGWSSTEKSRWGVLMAKRAIQEHLDGAVIIHRGDCVAWKDGDGSYFIQGDLDVEWEGRAPLFEIKSQLPALQFHQEGKLQPAVQGLDVPNIQDYRNVQRRSGRPFYVLFVWPDLDEQKIYVLGDRLDLLRWPPMWGLKNRKTKQGYWHVSELRSVRELAEDVESWSGAPYQEVLLA